MAQQDSERMLREDPNWVVLKSDGDASAIPFNRRGAVLIVEDPAENDRLCRMLVALGRETLDTLPKLPPAIPVTVSESD
jgi:hypothetical protein